MRILRRVVWLVSAGVASAALPASLAAQAPATAECAGWREGVDSLPPLLARDRESFREALAAVGT